jgi:O-antigen/teichoic acid export membrane protein
MEKKISVFEKATTDREKSERLVAGSIFSMLATIFGGAFMTAWMISTTQLLGPKDFGIFGPIFQSFWAVATLISLGINVSITTFVAHHWEKEKEEARKFSADGSKLMLIIGAAVSVLVILILLYLLFTNYITSFYFWLILVYTLGIFFNLQFWAIQGILLGVQRTDYYALGNFLFPTMNFIFSLILILLSQKIFGKESQIDIISATSGLLFGGFFGSILAMFLLKKVDVETYKVLYDFSKIYNLFKKIIKFGGISTIANLNYTIFNSISCVIVGILATKFGIFAENHSLNLKQSGYYSASYLYASAALMIMGLAYPLISAMSEAEAQGKRELMQHYLDLILKVSFAIITGVFIFYASVGGEIVHFLAGKEYPIEEVKGITIIISLGICFLSLFYLLLNIFFGVKRPQYAAISITIALIIQVIGLFFIPFLFKSTISAGFVLTISSFVAMAISIYYLVKNVNLKIKPILYIAPILSALPAYIIANLFVPKNGLFFFLCAGVLLLIYGAIYTIFDKLYLSKITANKF